MYGRLPRHNETGMRWFDFYFRTAVPILAVVRSLLVFSYIGMEDYFSSVSMLISALLNIGIVIYFRPCKKLMIRKYPKNLFYLTIIDNAISLISCLISTIIVIITVTIQSIPSLILTDVLFILNIVYFVKRKKYFGILQKTNISTAVIDNEQNVVIDNKENKTEIAITEQKNPTKEETIESKATLGVADEIKKYKELLDSGAITQEEFEQKKKQLLNL